MWTLRDKYAIAGIGYTGFSANSGTTVLNLALEACRKAVTEQVEGTTGLKVRAVNVLVTDVVFPEEQAASED